MARKQVLAGRYRRDSVGVVGVLAYLLLCGGLSFVGTGLAMRSGDQRPIGLSLLIPDVETPIATIQLSPGIDNKCQRLLFYNDSGRYQYGGAGACSNLTAWTPNVRRSDALVQAFRYK
jgi:hypothetical protein